MLTRVAALGGIAVLFLAGLVLPVWWLTGLHSAVKPGLDAYPSAYIGDTVLLPAGVLVMVLGIRRLPPAPAERIVGALAALGAAAVSVAVQIFWLRDPTTPANWTMPRPGYFDAAGWWHAAYFTAMSITLVTVTAIFLTRVRAGRRTAPERVRDVSSGRGAVLTLAVWGSYAALSARADLTTPLSHSALATIGLTVLTTSFITALVGAGYGRQARLLARPALASLGGIGMVICFVVLPLDLWLVVAVMTAALYQALAAQSRDRPRTGAKLTDHAAPTVLGTGPTSHAEPTALSVSQMRPPARDHRDA